MRDLPGLQPPKKVRPNLGLNEHHRLGPDGGQGAPDKYPAIHRVVNLANVGGEFFVQLAHPRGGGGGDDQLKIGQARLKNLDKLHANVHLSDTDRMQPDDVPVADGLLELGGIPAQPLAETLPPPATASHSQKIVGR